jgi:hypothetical protein
LASVLLAFWVGSKSSYTSSIKEPPVAKVVYQTSYRTVKPYGLFNFIVDICLTALTGGLWLIWVFCREMRRR